MAKYKGIPIIEYTSDVPMVSPGGVMRGYDGMMAGPAGLCCPMSSDEIVPRSEWPELIRAKDANEDSPSHWARKMGVKILDQKSYGYCWMYGLVGAMQNAYAMTGGYTPHLNAFYPAYLGKNGRNQGGWAGEAIEYVERYGVPHWGVFPDQPTNRSAFDRREVKASAELHKAVKFRELPRQNVDALVTALLVRKRVVTIGLMWWGHLVYVTDVHQDERGRFLVEAANSWGLQYGNQGRFMLTLDKAVAHEQIEIEIVSTVAA